MGRSTARRMLTGPRLPDPGEQVDGRTLRSRGFSDDARALLAHVWALMGMPCGKYLVVMLELWLPLLAAAGDLDKPFATEAALVELTAMSAATVDRYLKPARDRMRIKGISTTKPSLLLVAQHHRPPIHRLTHTIGPDTQGQTGKAGQTSGTITPGQPESRSQFRTHATPTPSVDRGLAVAEFGCGEAVELVGLGLGVAAGAQVHG
jgi:hypothetical protein